MTRLSGKRAGHSQVGEDETDQAATSPNDCRATRTKSARPSRLEATICWSEVRTEDVGTETGFARTLVDQVRRSVTCKQRFNGRPRMASASLASTHRSQSSEACATSSGSAWSASANPQAEKKRVEEENAPLRTRRERDTLGASAVRHDLGRDAVPVGTCQLCVLDAAA